MQRWTCSDRSGDRFEWNTPTKQSVSYIEPGCVKQHMCVCHTFLGAFPIHFHRWRRPYSDLTVSSILAYSFVLQIRPIQCKICIKSVVKTLQNGGLSTLRVEKDGSCWDMLKKLPCQALRTKEASLSQLLSHWKSRDYNEKLPQFMQWNIHITSQAVVQII